MKNEKLFEIIADIEDSYINDARIPKKKNTKKAWVRWGTIAACLILILTMFVAPLTNQHAIDNPLVIKAYAIGIDDQSVTVSLSLGERIQLSPNEFCFDADDAYEYFAFDLLLVDGMYLQLSSVDENWELILDKEIHYSDETTLPYWALTEGNEIALISTDVEGNVNQAYKDGTAQPRMKGNEMIWRVNDDGRNRCIIDCFNKDFNRVVSYYLEITEYDGLFYAEIVKIV